MQNEVLTPGGRSFGSQSGRHLLIVVLASLAISSATFNFLFVGYIGREGVYAFRLYGRLGLCGSCFRWGTLMFVISTRHFRMGIEQLRVDTVVFQLSPSKFLHLTLLAFPALSSCRHIPRMRPCTHDVSYPTNH
ncbi:hypothetical protein EJ06DRAFT_56594 [Trichodelitschia bisporula]|uniref:Uncharacterized protein n=1 Tax=Trichodelitschia bisporula TaxID=703511 RepID=A0A6G1HUY6_9PEZI|nr:hypothetical protein EJ06DRAFT_56594 [Trichodelitschia bisporula]